MILSARGVFRSRWRPGGGLQECLSYGDADATLCIPRRLTGQGGALCRWETHFGAKVIRGPLGGRAESGNAFASECVKQDGRRTGKSAYGSQMKAAPSGEQIAGRVAYMRLGNQPGDGTGAWT